VCWWYDVVLVVVVGFAVNVSWESGSVGGVA